MVARLHLRNRYPPTFIVGAPRSGTTLTYLRLFNTFRWSYFPNIARRHPDICVTATLFTRATSSYRATYENSYGAMEGLLAPSDGWEVFHRWFPMYEAEPVIWERLDELRTIVALLERVFRAPFLNKNNHNSTRIAALADTFANAQFVHVRRDVGSNVASLVEARRVHGVALGKWWSAAPTRFLGYNFSSSVEQAVATIVGLNEEIETAMAHVPRQQRMEVDYRDVCLNPSGLLDEIARRYESHGVILRRRQPGAPRALSISERAPDADLQREIRRYLELLGAQT